MTNSTASSVGRVLTLNPPFSADGGVAFLARLPIELHPLTDTDATPRSSPLVLLENGRPLPLPHATHNDIRAFGGGRYSFWKDALWFSASDGSDPNINGRRYEIQVPQLQDTVVDGRETTTGDGTPGAPSAPAASEAVTWVAPDRPIGVAIIGTGQRGFSFVRQLAALDGVTIRWLVDESLARMQELGQKFGLVHARTGFHWAEALDDPAVEAVFIAVPDYLHTQVAVEAFRARKRVYLEKPVATTMADARAVIASWRMSKLPLQLGYVLRHTPFYAAIHEMVRAGTLGRIRTVSLREQLGVEHGASFMRRWHRLPSKSGGLIVHKGCHDLDLACWLLGTVPRSAASFGGRDTFRRPAPAAFCSACPEQRTCAFVDTGAYEYRSAAEQVDPAAFGLNRCVFSEEDGIVDNQTVAFELANGVRGTFQLNVQGPSGSRREILIIGDDGRLSGSFEEGRFTIEFNDGRETVEWSADGIDQSGHGDGDRRSIIAFLDACRGRRTLALTVADALAGLALALAAEESRLNGYVARIDPSVFSDPGAIAGVANP